MVGAVLFFNCSKSYSSESSVENLAEIWVQDSISSVEFDSVRKLGKTGYEINLKSGFLFQAINDSTFRVYPAHQDTGCGQSLYIDFRRTPMKVPGYRPRFVTDTMLAQQITFRELINPNAYCVSRYGSIQMDSLYVQVTGAAPPDDRIERLFDIALSLRKSTVSGN